jgi:hypothetical protein
MKAYILSVWNTFLDREGNLNKFQAIELICHIFFQHKELILKG